MTILVNEYRRRLVLELLAYAGEQGYADPSFISRYAPELYHLVRDGLASAEEIQGLASEVACVKITDEGRQAMLGLKFTRSQSEAEFEYALLGRVDRTAVCRRGT